MLPPGKDSEVQELVDLSNVVLRFMRNTLWDHGDSFPYKMLPWPVYIIPGLRDIVGWIAKRCVYAFLYNYILPIAAGVPPTMLVLYVSYVSNLV